MAGLAAAYLVGAGGALGALLRYAVTSRVRAERFPLGTLTVNVAGTFALGLVTATGAGEQWVLLLGTGACGSFTTFSSFSVATVRLWEQGDRTLAAANAAANLLAAGAALALAWLLVGA